MIHYLKEEYKDINDMATKLRISPYQAAHMYAVNGGKSDDKEDLDVNRSLFVVIDQQVVAKANLPKKEQEAEEPGKKPSKSTKKKS